MLAYLDALLAALERHQVSFVAPDAIAPTTTTTPPAATGSVSLDGSTITVAI